MKNQIYELLSKEEGLMPQEIAAHILMAAVIGMVIYISYAISHRGTIYSKKFNVSLLILTVIMLLCLLAWLARCLLFVSERR